MSSGALYMSTDRDPTHINAPLVSFHCIARSLPDTLFWAPVVCCHFVALILSVLWLVRCCGHHFFTTYVRTLLWLGLVNLSCASSASWLVHLVQLWCLSTSLPSSHLPLISDWRHHDLAPGNSLCHPIPGPPVRSSDPAILQLHGCLSHQLFHPFHPEERELYCRWVHVHANLLEELLRETTVMCLEGAAGPPSAWQTKLKKNLLELPV